MNRLCKIIGDPLPAEAAPAKAGAVTARLGPRIRALRRAQRLTLDALAARSGVSRAMLSKVERAEKSPSLSIAVAIAGGLGVSLSALIGAEPDRAGGRIGRASARTAYVDPETGFERSVLVAEQGETGIEILLHVIPPGQSSGVLPAYAAPTDKYLIVQSGELSVRMGEDTVTLAAGDTFHFPLTQPYVLANAGAAPCAYYVVIARRGGP